LKLRYKDFTTITRAHSLEQPTQSDREIFEQVRRLFLANWKKGMQVRLLGVQTSNFETGNFEVRAFPGGSEQLDLLEPARDGRSQDGRPQDERSQAERWKKVLAAADHLRDKFGESTIGLATGMKGGFRERTHENPVGLPGKNRGGNARKAKTESSDGGRDPSTP
jgi:DNA polymerase-4